MPVPDVHRIRRTRHVSKTYRPRWCCIVHSLRLLMDHPLRDMCAYRIWRSRGYRHNPTVRNDQRSRRLWFCSSSIFDIASSSIPWSVKRSVMVPLVPIAYLAYVPDDCKSIRSSLIIPSMGEEKMKQTASRRIALEALAQADNSQDRVYISFVR